MTSIILPLQAYAGNRRPEIQRLKPISSGWWVPLITWSAEPDYIDSKNNNVEASTSDRKAERLAGGFNDKKARKLRMMTTGTVSHHGAMYHSAIATRLASDFSDRSDL